MYTVWRRVGLLTRRSMQPRNYIGLLVAGLMMGVIALGAAAGQPPGAVATTELPAWCSPEEKLTLVGVFGTLSEEAQRNEAWASLLGPKNDHLRGTEAQYLALAADLRTAHDFIEARLRECFPEAV